MTINKYALLATDVVNEGLQFFYGNTPVDQDTKAWFGAVNPQLLPDGSFVVNEFCKPLGPDPYAVNIYLVDKAGNVLKHVELPNEGLDHECIVGSNLPRYYTPEFDYTTANDKILFNGMYNLDAPHIADETVLDGFVKEIDWEGNVVWDWYATDHFDEFGFTDEEKQYIRENPIYIIGYGSTYDWLHINSVCAVGENKWYDEGDTRFHPENIICCSRNRSMIFIIDKVTKEVVYVLKGKDIEPAFGTQHYAHIIPKGLEGAGNLLFFDTFDGHETSRIIEMNPITKEVVFEYSEGFKSLYKSNVQKLPDGHYMIASAIDAQIIVVDKDKKVVSQFNTPNRFYRATAYPREWFHEHQFTQAEIAKFREIGDTERKHVPYIVNDLERLYSEATSE